MNRNSGVVRRAGDGPQTADLPEAPRETHDARPPALCSFSGGKDSCLALWRAQRRGFDVRTLLVMFEESGGRSRSHAIPLSIIERQAQALGIQLVTHNASWKSYEQVFTEALQTLRSTGHEVAIFGDIDLQAHRDWEEKVCAVAGVTAALPLWQCDRQALAREVIDTGFRAVVVCVDSRYLGDEFCGRLYDDSFLSDLPPGVDACGENGEFHTLVYDGPNFASPVRYAIDGFEDVVTSPEYGVVRYRFARLV
ncbi:MAG: diphthine--ammonia ligase [Steroidobacter sp.]